MSKNLGDMNGLTALLPFQREIPSASAGKPFHPSIGALASAGGP